MASVLAVLALAPAAVSCADPADPVVTYAADDADMRQAIEKATTSLPLFWRLAEAHPGDDHYVLKAGFDGPGQYKEHMWVAKVIRDGDKVRGVLASAPDNVPGLSEGDEVTFDVARISDWMIYGDCIAGGFTTRAMLEKSPPPNAAEIAAALCPNPLPIER